MLDEVHKIVIDLYTHTPPSVQTWLLVILLFASAWLLARKWSLKAELRSVRAEVREKNLDLEKAKAQLVESHALSEKLAQEGNELREKFGGLEVRLETVAKTLDNTRQKLQYTEAERAALEERANQLQRVDADVWCKEYPKDFAPPPFVSRESRKTVFVAVQNLKGGVGKTTLTANLGAAYATGVTGSPMKVLVVDLDFQGTLSNCCVDQGDLNYRRTNHLISARLLDERRSSTKEVLQQLAAGIPGTEGRGQVIVSGEPLEHADFRQQACFVMQHREVRFLHREFFHDNYVFGEFDLVLFDCPPRLTASSINALVASDFIVVPTTLHSNDVEAVPRTLKWFAKLAEIDSTPAKVAGILVNKTYHKEGNLAKLIKAEQRQLTRLKLSIHRFDPTGALVLEHAVPRSPEIVEYLEGSRPIGTCPRGHEIYGGVATELYQRMKG